MERGPCDVSLVQWLRVELNFRTANCRFSVMKLTELMRVNSDQGKDENETHEIRWNVGSAMLHACNRLPKKSTFQLQLSKHQVTLGVTTPTKHVNNNETKQSRTTRHTHFQSEVFISTGFRSV